MSNYGTIITNYNNKICIDNRFTNYALYATGSKTLYAGENYITCSINTPAMILLRPATTGYCSWVRLIKSGSTITSFVILSSTTQTIDYAILKAGQVNALSSYGYVMYDASGSVSFSDNDTYGKIKGIYYPTLPTVYSDPETTQNVYNTNGNYFLYTYGSIYWRAMGGYADQVGYYTIGMRKYTSGAIALKPMPWIYYSIPYGWWGNANGSAFCGTVMSKLIEVTI